MHQVQPKQYFAATQRAVANAEAIDWEELPSLAGSVAQRLAAHGSGVRESRFGSNDSAFAAAPEVIGTPWASTLTADLDPITVSPPFEETLSGLVTREVYEPDVFRHFFGPGAGGR
jgi:hypothetical protein